MECSKMGDSEIFYALELLETGTTHRNVAHGRLLLCHLLCHLASDWTIRTLPQVSAKLESKTSLISIAATLETSQPFWQPVFQSQAGVPDKNPARHQVVTHEMTCTEAFLEVPMNMNKRNASPAAAKDARPRSKLNSAQQHRGPPWIRSRDHASNPAATQPFSSSHKHFITTTEEIKTTVHSPPLAQFQTAHHTLFKTDNAYKGPLKADS
jgi:hypothetical protein